MVCSTHPTCSSLESQEPNVIAERTGSVCTIGAGTTVTVGLGDYTRTSPLTPAPSTATFEASGSSFKKRTAGLKGASSHSHIRSSGYSQPSAFLYSLRDRSSCSPDTNCRTIILVNNCTGQQRLRNVMSCKQLAQVRHET